MAGIQMFVDEGLGHSSYLIDVGDGTSAILDPPRFPTAHLTAARTQGTTPRWTIDTHSHADYVTGSPSLAADEGSTFLAPAASKLETPHHGVHDEERITLAPGVTMQAIATPGHTPDHHVFLLERGGTPVALFTGGSLMVGAVGRTDLCGPDLAEPLAHDMFHSLRRLAGLPTISPSIPRMAPGRSAPHLVAPTARRRWGGSGPRMGCSGSTTRTRSSSSCWPVSARSPRTSPACPS